MTNETPKKRSLLESFWAIAVVTLFVFLDLTNAQFYTECYTCSTGGDYIGQMNISDTNKSCFSWISPENTLLYTVAAYPDVLSDHNYCRNPEPSDGSLNPWCIVASGTWEYCNLPGRQNIPCQITSSRSCLIPATTVLTTTTATTTATDGVTTGTTESISTAGSTATGSTVVGTTTISVAKTLETIFEVHASTVGEDTDEDVLEKALFRLNGILNGVNDTQKSNLTLEEAIALLEIMENLTGIAVSSKEHVVAFLEVCEVLLKEHDKWASNDASRIAGSAVTMLDAFGLQAANYFLSDTITNETAIVFKSQTLVVQIQKTDLREIGDSMFINNNILVDFPVEEKPKKMLSSLLVSDTAHEILGGELELSEIPGEMGSKVTSFSVSLDDAEKKTDKIALELLIQLNNKPSNDQTPLCVFWKQESINSGGLWSDEGCFVKQANESAVLCQCDHLTSFAILMQTADNQQTLSDSNRVALEVLTYIGSGLSITGLVSTIIVYICLNLLKSQRIQIHTNLAVALLMGQIIYISGIDAVDNKKVCKTVAIFLHYFFTSVFSWSLVEGIQLYTKTIRVYKKGMPTWAYGIIGWIAPLFVVVISVAMKVADYGTPTSCWLSVNDGLIWAFVAPALFVISVNTIILITVMRVFMTLKANTSKTEKERIRVGIRAVLFLQPLLGLTWLFGFLSTYDSSLFFTYLFVICNSLQGLFIFALHCFRDDEVMKSFKHRRKLAQFASSNTTSSSVADSSLTVKKVRLGFSETKNSTVTGRNSTTSSGSNSTLGKEAWI